jgi:hypothetical protein
MASKSEFVGFVVVFDITVCSDNDVLLEITVAMQKACDYSVVTVNSFETQVEKDYNYSLHYNW